jgi:choline dehydrogenase
MAAFRNLHLEFAMYDFVIVGGGSAGCAIASRLSEDRHCRVLLLEQGSRDRNPYIHLPAAYYKTAKGNLLTRYKLEPQRGQNGITPEFVQGRVLGGGSSVNAMVYIRGCPEDYDAWAAEGAPGWSYREVLPYFRRSEDNESFSGAVHGQGGPLAVSDQRHTHYLTKAWLRACQESGINYNADFNSGSQAGCGLYQLTMRNGLRCSSAAAYLRPARNRRNLVIASDSKATKIVVENGRAVGVQFIVHGKSAEVRTSREVIVCSGAVGSPHLLLLSGIGPADQIRDAGLEVVHDLPGVGRNLQDHFDLFLIYELTGSHSYDKYKKLRWQAWAGLQYALFRNGPVSSNICEGGLFWYGDGEDSKPNLQYHFLPGAGVEEGSDRVPSGNGSTLNVYQTRPRSRGTITLKSSDPFVAPGIDPNYLAEDYDVECLAEGVRIGQEIMAQESLREYVSRPYRPTVVLRSKDERKQFVRDTGQGALHPSGACRMGTDDMAVVDPELRVRGIDRLRVADTSIMPRLVSGNTNAPAIMIGERAVDFIRGNFHPSVDAPDRS